MLAASGGCEKPGTADSVRWPPPIQAVRIRAQDVIAVLGEAPRTIGLCCHGGLPGYRSAGGGLVSPDNQARATRPATGRILSNRPAVVNIRGSINKRGRIRTRGEYRSKAPAAEHRSLACTR